MQRILVAFILLSLLAVSTAADVDIFSGSAVVATQSEADRDSGARAALKESLIKASGDASIAYDPGLPAVLAGASGLLRFHSYRETMQATADGASELRLRLDAQFDPAGVENALRMLGRPLWGRQRPTALIWLVIDNNGSKQIVSSFQQSALGALTSVAEFRGLPIQLPRLDGADLNRLDPVTLWDAPPATVIAASQRYNARVILVARLQKLQDRWDARYTLIDGRDAEHWTASDSAAAGVLAAAVNGAVDRVARRYAIDTSEPGLGQVTVWVEDVRSAADYATIMGYLGKLPAATDLAPQAAQAGRMLLRMQVAVGAQRFRQLLSYDRVLIWEPAPAADATAPGFVLRLAH
jgi:uncharacterized protein